MIPLFAIYNLNMNISEQETFFWYKYIFNCLGKFIWSTFWLLGWVGVEMRHIWDPNHILVRRLSSISPTQQTGFLQRTFWWVASKVRVSILVGVEQDLERVSEKVKLEPKRFFLGGACFWVRVCSLYGMLGHMRACFWVGACSCYSSDKAQSLSQLGEVRSEISHK